LTPLSIANNNASDATETDEQPQWSVERACLLLATNDREIKAEHFEFHGKLTIELSYQKGSMTNVKLTRQQTFKT